MLRRTKETRDKEESLILELPPIDVPVIDVNNLKQNVTSILPFSRDPKYNLTSLWHKAKFFTIMQTPWSFSSVYTNVPVSVCLESVDDPILTPCAHKMCRECLLRSDVKAKELKT